MSITKVDWHGFRNKSSVEATLNGLRAGFGTFGSSLSARPRKTGWNGFKQSADIVLGGMQAGLIAYGGEHQKGWISVNLTGDACKYVSDWDEAHHALSTLSQFETRRIDIALDTFKGEVSHSKVVDAYRLGFFNKVGKPPGMTRIEPEDISEGATCYIGKRTSDKFLRAYEKGYELAKEHPSLQITHIDRCPIADIYRLELELKAKTGPLPKDIISKRDNYFSGAYPYLKTVIDCEPFQFPRCPTKDLEAELMSALANIKKQYGPTLFTALTLMQGDVGKVWDLVVGTEHSEKLIAAGVFIPEYLKGGEA
jgi:phage replication initiation protein